MFRRGQLASNPIYVRLKKHVFAFYIPNYLRLGDLGRLVRYLWLLSVTLGPVRAVLETVLTVQPWPSAEQFSWGKTQTGVSGLLCRYRRIWTEARGGAHGWMWPRKLSLQRPRFPHALTVAQQPGVETLQMHPSACRILFGPPVQTLSDGLMLEMSPTRQIWQKKSSQKQLGHYLKLDKTIEAKYLTNETCLSVAQTSCSPILT